MTPHEKALRREKAGELIRARRRKMGVEQKELARMLGVSPPTLSSWERGRMPVSASRLAALAKVFGCTPAELTPPG